MRALHRTNWTIEILTLSAVLALGLLLRTLALDADPPADFHFYFLTDEGWWAHNARQHALFGQWILDDHNPALYVAPVYTLALRAVYECLGVGLVSTRLLSRARAPTAHRHRTRLPAIRLRWPSDPLRPARIGG